MSIKEKAQKAQKDLLFAILEIFKKNPEKLFGPADITREANLSKGLKEPIKHGFPKTSKQNDRFSQGLINELLNQNKLERVKNNNRYGYKKK